MNNQTPSPPRKNSELTKKQKSDKDIDPTSRSSRSNSVASSGSKHHRIQEDIQAKLQEAPEPIAPTKSTISLYLEFELQFFSEYIGLDLLKEFNFTEYIQWRRKAEKFNEFHNQLEKADIVIAQKYVMDSLNLSTFKVPDFSEEQYFEYRAQILPYFGLLPQYIADCMINLHDASYVGYEYFALYLRQRDFQVGMLRKEVIESNKVSYSESVFNDFVMSPNYRPDIGAYQAFYHEMQEKDQEEIKKFKEDVAALKKSIENLNLFIFDSFIEACTQQNVQPTIEGYKAHEEEVRKEFDDDYLQQKHDELDDEIEALGNTQKMKMMDDNFDDTEVEFLNKQIKSVVQDKDKGLKESEPPSQEEIQQKIIQSKLCPCCKGRPQECEGQACVLLGECICQTDY